jgi:predicted RNA binding protein YcfA (HicA-like mRNA interferase family)
MSEKIPLLTPSQIIAALSKKGFTFKSQKGSHAKYTNNSKTVIIPMHDEVARGTLKNILVQAGIDLSEFLKLL